MLIPRKGGGAKALAEASAKNAIFFCVLPQIIKQGRSHFRYGGGGGGGPGVRGKKKNN